MLIECIVAISPLWREFGENKKEEVYTLETVNTAILLLFVVIVPIMWFATHLMMSKESTIKKKIKGGIKIGVFGAILAAIFFLIAVSGHKIGVGLLVWGLMMPPLFIFIAVGLLYLLVLIFIVAKKIDSRFKA